VEAPAFVKNILGCSKVKVRELQTLIWHSATHFSVSSETEVLGISGANRFVTALLLHAEEGEHSSAAAAAAAAAVAAAAAAAGAGPSTSSPGQPELRQQKQKQKQSKGPSPTSAAAVAAAAAAAAADSSRVEVRFSVKCSAAMPWPLSASIEAIMADKAQASMSQYLDLCAQLVEKGAAAAGEADAALPGALSLHRWPTAIAISAFDGDGGLEAPLLGVSGRGGAFVSVCA
jgi:hypothetical protein